MNYKKSAILIIITGLFLTITGAGYFISPQKYQERVAMLDAKVKKVFQKLKIRFQELFK